MRSGTHLTIDLLLNNLSSYRNNPLYIDFDRFVYEAHDPNTLTNAGSCIIKTHFRQRPFTQETLKLLESIASNGLVIIPTRDLAATQASMKKWNFSPSLEKLQKDHDDQLIFWSRFNPLIIDFKDLLNPTKAISFLQDVRQRLHLPDSESPSILTLANGSNFEIMWNKMNTRLAGSHAKTINTTIGYKI